MKNHEINIMSLRDRVRAIVVNYNGEPAYNQRFYFDTAIDMLTYFISTKDGPDLETAIRSTIAIVKDELMQDTFVQDLLSLKSQTGGNLNKVLNPYTGRLIQRGGRVAKKLFLN